MARQMKIRRLVCRNLLTWIIVCAICLALIMLIVSCTFSKVVVGSMVVPWTHYLFLLFFISLFLCLFAFRAWHKFFLSVEETKYGDYLYVRFSFFLGPVINFFLCV
jgi:hypothetical protein